ncbi:DNA-binding response regulator, NarL/FixJ family, contains REC and HTH domains [Roseateles sp. YR242]|uniref:response regulator transcription factor n=1 Tax=Roseateles sp. YR242 TaxID=1855305 RepID=UPI0008D63FE2|nr:response regulator transcription factor [Roseateles sp. YR242]SEK35157.1 DNA-binding response regulator, NarL/FixJ family, contains REC and HTH domains [Roseateles sp. YR242]
MNDVISGPVRVGVQHCEPLLSIGIQAALREVKDIRLVSPAPAGDDAPHVLITDWSAGVQQASLNAKILPAQGRVLVISSQVREQPLRTALRQGIHGLLLSACSTRELVCAIFALAEGRSYVCADVAQRMAISYSREPLTAREEEVLGLIWRGQCNKSIAHGLGIAPGTVKSHVKSILGKLAASSRTEAASIAAELGMVEVAGWERQPARRSPSSARWLVAAPPPA